MTSAETDFYSGVSSDLSAQAWFDLFHRYVCALGFTDAFSAQTLKLSQREVQLIQFLGDGMNAVQIARQLGTSEQWIRKSFMRVREKLQVASNPELLLKAHELDLL